MNSIEILNWAESNLSSFDIENPRKNAEIILSYVTKIPILNLYAEKIDLAKKPLRRFKKLISKRGKGIPVQHITFFEEFMGFKFAVNKHVLIPRPETELLIEKLTEIIDREYHSKEPLLLDMGTGSGNIAISLTKLRNFSKIYASDISKKALKVASKNALRNDINGKISFIYSDIYERLSNLKGKLDFIVSNPPYISSKDYKGLQRELKYEPKNALYGGKDGLSYYRLIIKQAPIFIKESGGYLAFEIGYDQKRLVCKMLDSISAKYEVYKDYSKKDRIIIAKINSN